MNEAIYDVTNLYEAVKVNDKLAKENHELYKELDQYKNNWKELKKWLLYSIIYRNVLDKMKELEENK